MKKNRYTYCAFARHNSKEYETTYFITNELLYKTIKDEDIKKEVLWLMKYFLS